MRTLHGQESQRSSQYARYKLTRSSAVRIPKVFTLHHQMSPVRRAREKHSRSHQHAENNGDKSKVHSLTVSHTCTRWNVLAKHSTDKGGEGSWLLRTRVRCEYYCLYMCMRS